MRAAARLDGDVLIPLEASDVGAMLAAGGAARERDGVPAVPATVVQLDPRPPLARSKLSDTVVPPEYEFAPCNVSVPPPTFTRAPLPEIPPSPVPA